MSDLIIAVLIVVISQYILKVLVEPFIEFQKVRSEVSYQALLNQGNIISSPLANKELALTFKRLSANLIKSVNSIIGYRILRALSFNRLPSHDEVKEASRMINLLYHNLRSLGKNHDEVFKSLKQISEHLKIDTSYS